MSDGIPVPYFLARPTGGIAGRPALVVVLEGNGMSQQLLRVCQRLAGEGYAAIAPDLFHRFGGSDANADDGRFAKLRPEDGLADIADCIAVLREAGASSIGITGFCMGGLYSYLAATRGLDVQAAVPFYGRMADSLGTLGCPALIFFGGSDPWIPPADIERVRAAHGNDVVVYDDADHGFMRDGSENYHPAHAADAWARMLAFFGEHLR
jgi:carboxymethylenebutenolidase